MEFKKGDFVKLLNEKEIYIIDDIKDNEVCIKGYTHRIIKLVNVEEKLPKITINLVYIKKYLTIAPKYFIENYLKININN